MWFAEFGHFAEYLTFVIKVVTIALHQDTQFLKYIRYMLRGEG